LNCIFRFNPAEIIAEISLENSRVKLPWAELSCLYFMCLDIFFFANRGKVLGWGLDTGASDIWTALRGIAVCILGGIVILQ